MATETCSLSRHGGGLGWGLNARAFRKFQIAMKRKPLLLALALLLVVGAALWGVNYRLDHPPLTKADKGFRALVAGANRVEIVNNGGKGNSLAKQVELDEIQTRELIENIRLFDRRAIGLSSSGSSIILVFWKNNEMLNTFVLNQRRNSSEMLIDLEPMESRGGKSARSYYDLNPRFNKRLNRALDAYLPQRIRP